MKNIRTAKSALKAELAHVQAGLSYYHERVEALSEALDKLDTIDDAGNIDVKQTGKKARGRPKAAQPKAASRVTGKPAKKSGAADLASRLPATGGDFFPALITDQGKTAAELLQAAVAQLPFKPNAQETVQLRSRMVSALFAMVKAGKIASEGTGRQRIYFTE